MYVRRLAVHLSRAAERDIESILLYTRRTWGEKQRVAYRAAIFHALERLSLQPQASRPRDELFPGCRSTQLEQHLIYFHQPRAGEIEVLRILHRRQDASAAMQEPR